MAKPNEIEDEIKETRQHIEETGSAMVGKLELLEERLREGVEGVKRTFDLHYQAEQHPLALFGGSVMVGFLIGNLLGGGSEDETDAAGNLSQSSRAISTVGNGVKNHLTKEIAGTVKGMAAGALTSTLLGLAKQIFMKRGGSSDQETLYGESQGRSYRGRRV